VFKVADRLAVLYLGRMVTSGPLSDYDTSSAVHWMTTGAAPSDHAITQKTAEG
jgi:D-xylose transport system permease protein